MAGDIISRMPVDKLRETKHEFFWLTGVVKKIATDSI